ncbi:MAG: hypothetical protein LBB23_00885 [Rickettsiales bacterium]|nr:hypothetical protein [Rickettsiales bacterium]
MNTKKFIFLSTIAMLIATASSAFAAEQVARSSRSSQSIAARTAPVPAAVVAAQPVAAVPAAVAPTPAAVVVSDPEPETARASIRMGSNVMSANSAAGNRAAMISGISSTSAIASVVSEPEPVVAAVAAAPVESNDGTVEECKESYFNCMDQFCLLEYSDGERCACSAQISSHDKAIAELKRMQTEAEKIMNEGVEREKLGAKADLVMGAKNVKVKKTLNLSFDEDEDGSDDVAEVAMRGAELYTYASNSCKERLAKCGTDSEMTKTLYGQQIQRDCGAFTKYLGDQKKVVENNKLAAERSVRAARVEMLGQTNKYNRGECVIAMKDCVATKGGCGTNFENCLDAKLLTRRSSACENILEQCMAVRNDVEKDWAEEQKAILVEAAKFADRNRRGTCLARVDSCLEESCAPTVNDQCLTDVRIARGVCPVMDECDQLVPGLANVYSSRLAAARTRFCENDLSGCFKNACGANYNNPACVGKSMTEIGKMCPQRMFPSCSGMQDYAAIQASVFMQVDFALMAGCINEFAEVMGRTCGADMALCVPESVGAPMTINSIAELNKYDYKADVSAAVNKAFTAMESDPTIANCKGSMGKQVFTTSKLLGTMLAEQRASRNFVRKLAELTKAADLETARQQCEKLGEKGKDSEGSKIESVVFQPALRNCHICRVQIVKEKGGMDKGSAAMQAGAGGMAAGAAIGTKIAPGIGSAIGAGVGALGGALFGALSAKETEDEQKLTSCEDVNM